MRIPLQSLVSAGKTQIDDGEVSVTEAAVQMKSVLEPAQQLALDSVHEDYVMDTQWESMLEDVPIVSGDDILFELQQEFGAKAVLKKLTKSP
jgi:isopentenyl phosphate kinase